jgi:uncharacterized phiE125 gp8 family phage protein
VNGSYSMTPDWTTLPAALLPTAKQHMRVDFTDDDEIITNYLQFAISYFENQTGLAVFGSTVAWLPNVATGASQYQCPAQPVSSFVVTSETVDVSSEYALQSASPIEPVWLVKSDGTAWPADAAVDLVVGFTAAAQIRPSVLGDILRIAASLYEHRESISTLSLEHVPFWMNDLLTAHWIPRA